MSEGSNRSGKLLIYAPVPLYRGPMGLLLEDQACNGLRLWAEHFETVAAIMPVRKGSPPESWVPIKEVGPNLRRIDIIPVPEAYRPDQFFRQLPRIKPLIRAEIEKADYLSFSIGGLFGDWGSVGCMIANRMNREYAIWTDRVESEVVRRTAFDGNWRNLVRARVTWRPMAWLERYLIRRSALGLFHGKETFDTYAPYSANPKIVHDIHIKRHEHITEEALAKKTRDAATGPLKICYVGRADAMKGPLEWLEALSLADRAGVDFRATWIGNGALFEEMQAATAANGLSGKVTSPGFIKDRTRILAALKDAHLFLFCHKTPESPRCLIEALISGTPIIGYRGAFAQSLIEAEQGGRLVPISDTQALAKEISAIALDRTALAELIRNAAKSGAPYNDEAVFQHRSDLIKGNLS